MINIFKIFKKTKKINEPEFSDFEKIDEPFSDFEKIVLKMCNGEATLHDFNKYEVYFKHKKKIYGMWFANDIYGITLYSINTQWISNNIQKQCKIRQSLRTELWDKYGELYQQFKDGLNFKEVKEFEEKYSIKIIKK